MSVNFHAFDGRFRDAHVLVTGHTGFKGRWLVRWLSHCGAVVHGLSLSDRSDASQAHPRVPIGSVVSDDHRGDIRDGQFVADTIRRIRPRFVFHLAAQALVRRSYEDPVHTLGTNVMGTANVLEACRQLTDPCSVVIVTTDKCYQNREWLHGYRETDPLGGHDPYSASKAAAEIITASYRDSYFNDTSLRVATARAGNVIGGGDWAEDRIVPDCIRAWIDGTPTIVRNCHSTRPWQHVLEPLSGYLSLAAQLDASDGSDDASDLCSAFNFGPSLQGNRTVADLVNLVTKQLPGAKWIDASEQDSVHEAGRLDLAIAKAHHQLRWQPVWGFETTVRQTVDWYRSLMSLGSANRALRVEDQTDRQIEQYVRDARSKNLAWALPDLSSSISKAA